MPLTDDHASLGSQLLGVLRSTKAAVLLLQTAHFKDPLPPAALARQAREHEEQAEGHRTYKHMYFAQQQSLHT